MIATTTAVVSGWTASQYPANSTLGTGIKYANVALSVRVFAELSVNARKRSGRPTIQGHVTTPRFFFFSSEFFFLLYKGWSGAGNVELCGFLFSWLCCGT